jgi:hypothetical protein
MNRRGERRGAENPEGIDVNAAGSPAENEKSGQKGKVLGEL